MRTSFTVMTAAVGACAVGCPRPTAATWSHAIGRSESTIVLSRLDQIGGTVAHWYYQQWHSVFNGYWFGFLQLKWQLKKKIVAKIPNNQLRKKKIISAPVHRTFLPIVLYFIFIHLHLLISSLTIIFSFVKHMTSWQTWRINHQYFTQHSNFVKFKHQYFYSTFKHQYFFLLNI